MGRELASGAAANSESPATADRRVSRRKPGGDTAVKISLDRTLDFMNIVICST
jgi:hypothetical protein